METKLQSKQQYPRFIQNKPCGIDKFDGGSQERLAKTIARHFCQNDSLDEECTLPRIIGIEGIDRKSTRLNSSHSQQSRMPSSA